jgi:hypothetical protein
MYQGCFSGCLLLFIVSSQLDLWLLDLWLLDLWLLDLWLLPLL